MNRRQPKLFLTQYESKTNQTSPPKQYESMVAIDWAQPGFLSPLIKCILG